VYSAGSTGAAVAASQLKLRTLAGIDRPGIAAVMPTPQTPFVLLDAGATIDCTARIICQFALMGEVYTREILGVENPRIGLLSIGEEDSKGNDTSKEAFKILKALPGLNFVGNVESKDVFKSKVDVVACDGFVGNVVLKTSEAVASAMSKWLKASLTASLRRKLCALLLKDAFLEIKHKTDPETYGGRPAAGRQRNGHHRPRLLFRARRAQRHPQRRHRRPPAHQRAHDRGDEAPAGVRLK
jgi:glycerol-3-phosphate acyltransferase PlsX